MAAVLIALSCGAASANQGEPSNPLTDKAAAVGQAKVYLLCDSAEDETVYFPIPVSGEKQDELNSPTETGNRILFQAAAKAAFFIPLNPCYP